MIHKNLLACCSLLLGLAACSEGTIVDEMSVNTDEVTHISAIVDGYGTLTRSELYRDGDAINFRWSAGDKLGIFPDTGSQVYFAIEPDQDGSMEASFDGGGWALKKSHTYVAYYPYQKNADIERNAILLDFDGQMQTGSGTYTHLGKYDYLASDAVSPVSGGLSFTMNHQASILLLQLTVPEAGDYIYCTLSADSEIFTTLASMDLTGSTPTVSSKEKAKTITLQLGDVETTTANEVITLSMMVYPVNLTAKTIKVSLFEKDGNVYTGNIDETKNLEKGKPYQMTATLAFDRVDSYGIISFADKTVKSICVNNWDVNGDGELSFYEAANVKNISTLFANNANIRSFDEFKYFTGIQYVIAESFKNCTSLESIEFPSSIKMINSGAFSGCTKLSKVLLNENLTNIGTDAFNGCTGLASIVIPANVNTIGASAFIGCTKLSSITIPEGVTTIAGYTFQNCSNLGTVNLPSTLTTIGEHAFDACSNLCGIDIPANVNQIDACAFQNCSCLLEITLPEGLTIISDNLFNSCTNLLNVTIPSSVTSINYYSFFNCSSLIEVEIPEKVSSIGVYTFANCISLTKITVLCTSVPNISYGAYDASFKNTNNCPIYVPAGSVADYKNSIIWSAYAGRIQAIP